MTFEILIFVTEKRFINEYQQQYEKEALKKYRNENGHSQSNKTF